MSKILLVEDEPNQGLMVQEQLEDEGHSVIVVHSGPAALDSVRDVRPDVVVLDIAMPGMDGIETLARLLAKDNQLPVIIHTAYAQYKDNFMSWSADAYVIKSSDLVELKATIQDILAKREPRPRQAPD